jgi:rhamnogalacturonan endolyase
LKNGKLEKLWHFDGDEENPVLRSQGAHNMVSGDVDSDGKDEILLGSCMLDDNGTLLWSAGLGHSDKAYLTQLDPKRQGMQVFLVSEPWQTDGRGVMLVDAKTGQQIWKIGQRTYHVGDGMVADFDPAHPGLECFASEDKKGGSDARYLLTSDGKKLNSSNEEVPDCRNWAWWDGDLLREIVGAEIRRPVSDEGVNQDVAIDSKNNRRGRGDWSLKVSKWKAETLTPEIKGDIQMIADLNGDWREEIITVMPGEIRIYQTNIPAKDRRISLMQDPVYRSYVLQRSQGYPQSPVPGYYLGE